MAKILVVDDDDALLHTVSLLLTRHGCEVSQARNGREALECLSRDNFDVVVTDLRMEEMSGLDLLRRIKANSPEVEVILLTAFGSIENAVEAMRAEAFEYVTKPFKSDELIVVVDKALERRKLVAEVKYLREVLDYKYNFGTIIGQFPAIRKVIDLVGKYSGTSVALLVKGESGTGKELVAKAVHDNSARKRNKFLAVNCSAAPDELLAVELFGQMKGVSPTVDVSRIGLIEEADGGTLFIEDIADLSADLQARLCALLQRGVIRPIGSDSDRSIDVRVIAATTQNLSEAVEKKLFRKGLFDILTANQIILPRLRERGEDVLLLAEHFVKKYCREFGKLPMALTPETARTLMRHSWPCNVRELENAIKRTVALANSDKIRSEDLILVTDVIEGPHRLLIKSGPGREKSLENKELEYILSSLRENGWNYTRTARQLGIGRTTLWRKMKKIKEREATAVDSSG